MLEHHQNRIAIALPSVRVDTLTRTVMEEIRRVRKTGFTIAPEAGTQRLRNVINKGITEEEILATAEEIFAAGWNLVKLYFMIGLPTETQEDIEGIVELCRKISKIARKGRGYKQINISIATFVPKPHTPFQWEAQMAPDIILEKQHFLKSRLRHRDMRVKWHNYQLSVLEGVFSRGDRRLSQVLLKAHEMGAGFDGWSEHFNPALWDTAFQECSIDKNFYLRKRPFDECLPWEHIRSGVDTDFLKKEYEKALQVQVSPDCRIAGCQGCGLCEAQKSEMQAQKALTADNTPALPLQVSSSQEQGPVYRYQLQFSKLGQTRFLSHLELAKHMARTLRKVKLPLKYSQGFHPHPRIVFHNALPVGMESQVEFLDIELTQRIPAEHIPNLVNRYLQPGLKILTAEEIPLKKSAFLDKLKIKKYLISLPFDRNLNIPHTEEIKQFINNFLSKEEFFIQSVKKRNVVTVDIRPIVQQILLRENNSIEVALDQTGQNIPKVAEIAGAILHLNEKEQKGLKILKLASSGSEPKN
jgi:radical SAM-linked protein